MTTKPLDLSAASESSSTTNSDCWSAVFSGQNESSPIHDLRCRAFAQFQKVGFPTLKDEQWRATSVKSLVKTTFAASIGKTPTLTRDQISGYTLNQTDCHEFVFINGRFVPELSDGKGVSGGVVMTSLSQMLRDDPDTVRELIDRDIESQECFTALNTAFLEEGAYIRIPQNLKVEKPIHLLHLTVPTDDPIATHPRTILIADSFSEATIIETHAALEDGIYLTNTVTDVVVSENANINHLFVQQQSNQAFHVSGLRVTMEQHSTYTGHSFAIGGMLVRNNIDGILDGENINATFNGLTLTRGTQHIDNHLRIDHLKPHGNSWEYYKGILDDQSRQVFSGRIFVEEDAQKTDAKQTNSNLLLTTEGHVDTRPQLEIFADDVKCTHGATIGQLEESQLFYLQARGIPTAAARSMLVFAFANEVIELVPVEEIRGRLHEILLKRLPQGELLLGGL